MGISSEDNEADIGLLISKDHPCLQSLPSNFPTTRSSEWNFRGLALALAAFSGVLLVIFAVSHVHAPTMSNSLNSGVTSLFPFFHRTVQPVQPPPIAQTITAQSPPIAKPATGGGQLMSFYMYRAQGDDNYSPRNVNMADLPGVLWYLQHEVVMMHPRKFGITRIIRYRVTMKTTDYSLRSTGSQFGPFVAYDAGRCTIPDCENVQRKTGYVVGCAIPGHAQWGGHYVSLATVPCKPPHCKEGIWYSLPAKGGNCPIDDQKISVNQVAPVTGTPGCTYFAKWAGEIRLNSLIGLPPSQAAYNSWIQGGNQEYNETLDHGVCQGGHHCSFWNGRFNQFKCDQRQRYIMHLFDTKYPDYPKSYQLYESPPCTDLRPIVFPNLPPH